MKIYTKRIYDEALPGDGVRILVDRLWPRGISGQTAQIAFWAKDISPSNELRKWYRHDPGKWETFKMRYFAEIELRQEALEELVSHMTAGTVTFLYSSREPELNNAAALKEYFESAAGKGIKRRS